MIDALAVVLNTQDVVPALLTGTLTGRLVWAVVGVTAVAAANHVGVHLALGGYANSGGYLIWGVAVTLVAGLVLPRGAVLLIAGLYCTAAVVLGLSEATLAAGRPAPDPDL